MANGFLKENNGNFSLIRLQSLIVLFVSIFVICYQTVLNTIDIILIVILLGFAFFPKVMQKIIENQTTKPL